MKEGADFSGVTHYTHVDVQPGGINIQNVEHLYQADILKQLGIELAVKDSKVSTDVNQQVVNIALTPTRQSILEQLQNYADKGDWVNGATSDSVKMMLRTVLGQGETPLSANEAEQSETLWHLLENGRGDRVKILWQNMVGYLDDRKLFRLKGSPALNKDFFGDDKGYTNIDKGRPSKGLMTADFESIIPLLDAYCPEK